MIRYMHIRVLLGTYAPVICNHGQTWGRAGDSQPMLCFFYFYIVPTVREKIEGLDIHVLANMEVQRKTYTRLWGKTTMVLAACCLRIVGIIAG